MRHFPTEYNDSTLTHFPVKVNTDLAGHTFSGKRLFAKISQLLLRPVIWQGDIPVTPQLTGLA